jgi:tetratricopeptide (TPR) repeat protein/transglutaminase-like putative cysteine protease
VWWLGAAALVCLATALTSSDEAGAAPTPAAQSAGQGLAERRFAAAAAVLTAAVDKPESVAAVATLVSLVPEVGVARVRPLFEAVMSDRKSHPLVAAQAANFVALWAADSGDDTAAAAIWRGLGLIENASVCGPFEATGRGSIDEVNPPEQAKGGPAPGRRFAGKLREVAWRESAGLAINGALALDAFVRPDKEAAAYVLLYVRSERARAAVLRLGSPGPLKVWAGGKQVLRHEAVRESRLDQDAAAIALPQGESAILIKSVVLSGAWRLYARLTDADGRPLSGITVKAVGRAALSVSKGAAAGTVAAKASPELGALLRQRAEALDARKDKGAAAAWLDYGRWLTLSRQTDRDGKQEESVLERAADGTSQDDGGRLLATDALLLLGERAVEPNDRREALDRALALAPDQGRKAEALAGLGELARAQRREREALTRFREAVVADPENLDAALALASEEESAGLPAAALARLSALPPRRRARDRVELARARLLEAQGRRQESEAIRTAVFAHRRTDLDVALTLARSARDRGDLTRAIALHEEGARRRPDLTFLATEAARMREGQGDFAKAQAVLEALTVRLPDEASLWEELGRFLIRRNDLAGGSKALRTALTLRPQNPMLRRYLARIEGQLRGEDADTADELVRRYAEDGEALARGGLRQAASAAPVPGGTEVLLEKNVVRVHRNGLSERFVQRVVAIQTERGARESLEQGIRYTPGSQEVEIRRARIYRPSERGDDVDIIEVAGRDDRDLSEPWYGLYYDVRAEVVLYEGLRPGDVLELSYTLADVSFENLLRDYFGDVELIGDVAPRRRWEYLLLAPAERKIFVNQPAVPGLERTETVEGDERLTRFVARDIAPVRPEAGMPGWTEVLPYLHLSTFAGWEDVGRWYWQLIADQLAADEPLRRAARAAIADASTTLAQVQALHRFVIESTRYVGLEFGIHGYKPYKVTQVMARRFGDCKDKASLLHVLLREAGIESEIVLLRTRRSGRLAPFPASLAVFDHAIVYVPALKLYLDGTAEYSGMRELPSEDQGVLILRVSPGRATLTETPILPAADNRVMRRWTATLNPQGGARIEEEISVAGQAAPEWREHYETPGERQERFARVWEGRFPGATLTNVTIDGVEDRNQPVVAKSTAEVPELAEADAAGLLRLPVAAREPDYLRSYGRLSSRRQVYLLAYPFEHEERLTYALPTGWATVEVPPPTRLTSPFGAVTLTVEKTEDGRGVRVTSQIAITQNRIPPEQYLAFRAFLGQIDRALRQTIAVRPGGRS